MAYSLQQALVTKAQEIASRYPPNEVSRYQAAAEVLRIPYWDWATDPNMPSVIAGSSVQIRTWPNATQEQVINPLFDYDYPLAVEQGQYGSYDGGDRTRRCSAFQANGALSGSGLTSQVVRGHLLSASEESVG
jgi:hypothetical protein